MISVCIQYTRARSANITYKVGRSRLPLCPRPRIGRTRNIVNLWPNNSPPDPKLPQLQLLQWLLLRLLSFHVAELVRPLEPTNAAASPLQHKCVCATVHVLVALVVPSGNNQRHL